MLNGAFQTPSGPGRGTPFAPTSGRNLGLNATLSSLSSRLLGLLTESELAQLQPHLERVPLKRRQVLHERNLPLQYAYFIESGAAALVCREGHGGVEVATLGSMDFVGIPIVLGSGRSSYRCVVQVPGQALRLSATRLGEALDDIPGLRRLLLRYTHFFMSQAVQLAACNSKHSLGERLARSLLLLRECLQEDTVRLTHECLGRALGVRRASVTTMVGALEAAGVVRRGRGELAIEDPERLAQISCTCHRAIASERQRLRWLPINEGPRICAPLARAS